MIAVGLRNPCPMTVDPLHPDSSRNSSPLPLAARQRGYTATLAGPCPMMVISASPITTAFHQQVGHRRLQNIPSWTVSMDRATKAPSEQEGAINQRTGLANTTNTAKPLGNQADPAAVGHSPLSQTLVPCIFQLKH